MKSVKILEKELFMIRVKFLIGKVKAKCKKMLRHKTRQNLVKIN